MKNVLTPLAPAPATDAAIQKQTFGSGHPSDLPPQH